MDDMLDVPATAYKYLTSDRTRSVLEKLLIRFSQASVLNDALEFRPVFKGMGDRNYITQAVRNRLQEKHPEIFARIRAKHPPKIAAQWIAEIVSAAADAVASEENVQRSIKEVYRSLDANFGVLSLSETPASPLLWSHYADGGRGMLIEFDPQHHWFWDKKQDNDSFRHLHRVRYLERTPNFFLTLPDETYLYTKSVEWSYEREWRIIRNFNDAAVNVGKDQYDKDVLLFAVPPSCISGVVFGYKTNADVRRTIATTAKSNAALAHLTFSEATLGDDGSISISPYQTGEDG